ncbi:MAG: acetylglutamate kinase [Candidatus Omnitrophica bacterium]|nr:acetylglutamate kinase [Candidatus Omnitrophota bacterium]
MEEIIKKADVLIEAMPYIKAFRNKIFVIKYGGKIILSETAQKNLLEDLFLYFVGIRPVLVHGGGPFINQRAAQLGRVAKFVEGRRVTDETMIKIVEDTLKEINQKLVSMVKELGVEARGWEGRKEEIIRVKKKMEGEIDLGFVGEITEINSQPIKTALREKAIPIIAPLGKGKDKLTYNVNADEVAAAIAVNLKAEKLIILTDTKGILRNPEDEGSLISTLTQKEVEELIERKVIQSGMIPKVKACIEALGGGVKKTHIVDGRISHVILLEIFTDKGIGTEIVKG